MKNDYTGANKELILAAAAGSLEGVRLALEDGAAVDTVRPEGQMTALHLAAQKGHVAVAEHLLRCGAWHGWDSEYGYQPLHWASIRGHKPMVELLLAHGVDVDAQTELGAAALHNAVESGYVEIARSLLDAGADVHLQGESSVGPVSVLQQAEDMLAQSGGQGQQSLWARQIMDMVLQYEAMAEIPLPLEPTRQNLTAAVNGETFTPLDQPKFWQEFNEVTGRMQENGESPLCKADLLQTNKEGVTFLERAVQCQAAGTVLAYLRERGEPLTAQDLVQDGKPSAILDTFMEKQALDKLMQVENWKAQGSSQYRQVLNALPEDAKSRLPSTHAALATLRREERIMGGGMTHG